VIAVDTNILVYSHREDSPWHQKALRCVTDLAEGVAPWAIPWPCLHEFLAIVTHPRIYTPPTPISAAFGAVQAFVASPSLVLLGEGPGHIELLRDIAVAAKASGPLMHDARVAAVCLSARVRELWTADRDFGRFPRLKVRNPLV
jgi:toxin-antitoxin system PIN domain toxin